jgi:Protein of unknown function (DUF2637)
VDTPQSNGGTARAGRAQLARILARVARSPLVDNPLLLAVAAIGFSVSFQTISGEAAAHGLPGWPPLYPIGIDAGILALILEARKLAALKRSDLVPRILAWGLAIGTIYINIHGSPPHDWLGRAMHAIMPALWIVFLELTRWRQRAGIRKADKADPIPLARWLLDPAGTARLKRRMVTQNVLSYRTAVALNDARLFMRDLARAHYGGRWGYWRLAPSLLRTNIRKGRVGDDVTRAVTEAVRFGRTGGWEAVVIKAVTDAVTRGDELAGAVRQKRRQEPARAATPEPATAPRQNPPRQPATTRQAGRAKAERLLADGTPRTEEQVAALSGVSVRTVQRIKGEQKENRRLSVVAGGGG